MGGVILLQNLGLLASGSTNRRLDARKKEIKISW